MGCLKALGQGDAKGVGWSAAWVVYASPFAVPWRLQSTTTNQSRRQSRDAMSIDQAGLGSLETILAESRNVRAFQTPLIIQVIRGNSPEYTSLQWQPSKARKLERIHDSGTHKSGDYWHKVIRLHCCSWRTRKIGMSVFTLVKPYFPTINTSYRNVISEVPNATTSVWTIFWPISTMADCVSIQRASVCTSISWAAAGLAAFKPHSLWQFLVGVSWD
jgi:hypothetical protein